MLVPTGLLDLTLASTRMLLKRLRAAFEDNSQMSDCCEGP